MCKRFLAVVFIMSENCQQLKNLLVCQVLQVVDITKGYFSIIEKPGICNKWMALLKFMMKRTYGVITFVRNSWIQKKKKACWCEVTESGQVVVPCQGCGETASSYPEGSCGALLWVHLSSCKTIYSNCIHLIVYKIPLMWLFHNK